MTGIRNNDFNSKMRATSEELHYASFSFPRTAQSGAELLQLEEPCEETWCNMNKYHEI